MAGSPGTPPATAGSLPRTLVLVALTIHFFSLFLQYQDNTGHGMLGYATDTTRYTTLEWWAGKDAATGLALKPYAVFVIPALLFVWCSRHRQHPFWQRYGYWATLVLLLVFATGGALVRTTGGQLSMVSLGLVGLATYLDRKARKAAP